jgi:hypothetical protein
MRGAGGLVSVTESAGGSRMSSKYVVVSGAIFGVIAVVQTVRALSGWAVQVGGLEIPLWVSWIVAVVSGSLCVWAYRSGRS